MHPPLAGTKKTMPAVEKDDYAQPVTASRLKKVTQFMFDDEHDLLQLEVSGRDEPLALTLEDYNNKHDLPCFDLLANAFVIDELMSNAYKHTNEWLSIEPYRRHRIVEDIQSEDSDSDDPGGVFSLEEHPPPRLHNATSSQGLCV